MVKPRTLDINAPLHFRTRRCARHVVLGSGSSGKPGARPHVGRDGNIGGLLGSAECLVYVAPLVVETLAFPAPLRRLLVHTTVGPYLLGLTTTTTCATVGVLVTQGMSGVYGKVPWRNSVGCPFLRSSCTRSWPMATSHRCADASLDRTGRKFSNLYPWSRLMPPVLQVFSIVALG